MPTSKPVRIYFHGDTDGCCSAALISDWLEQKGRTFELYPLDADFVGDFVGDFFLDLANVKKNNVHSETIVIDHHPILEKLPCKQLNPRLEGEDWPTSYECYLNYGREELCWIAELGCVGDSQPQPVLEECVKKRFGKIDFEKASFMVDAFRSVKGISSTVEVVIKLLECRKDPSRLIRDQKLNLVYEEAEKEIQRILKTGVKIEGKLLTVNFSSKYSIKSQLSNIIKKDYPNKVVMISQETQEGYKISLRQEKQFVDFSQLIPKLIEGLQAAGGGHPKASGVAVSRKDFPEFVRRLKNALR